jgi:hypothetical protein
MQASSIMPDVYSCLIWCRPGAHPQVGSYAPSAVAMLVACLLTGLLLAMHLHRSWYEQRRQILGLLIRVSRYSFGLLPASAWLLSPTASACCFGPSPHEPGVNSHICAPHNPIGTCAVKGMWKGVMIGLQRIEQTDDVVCCGCPW